MTKRGNIDDFKDVFGFWRKSDFIDGLNHPTLSGAAWSGMNRRCIVGGSCQVRQTSYIGCKVSENFGCFQYFTNWHRAQVGYGIPLYQLDKDILVYGNKVYSEETVVIVPASLNTFILDNRVRRGLFKVGVQAHKYRGKFRADISVSGTKTYLGLYDTEDEAHAAYKVAKEAEAYRWYERLKAGEFIVDPRVIEAMRTWTLPE